MMNFQSVYTISVPVGTGAWDTDIQLTPHPVSFANYYRQTVAGAVIGVPSLPLLNTQLVGATHINKYDTLSDISTSWRLAYFGCTVSLDAPALSNQGTIVVCQRPIQANTFHVSGYNSALPMAYAGRKLLVYHMDSVPSFATTQAMPNAYCGLAKEGAYIPMKLSRTSQQWMTTADSVLVEDSAGQGAWGQDLDLDASYPVGVVAAPLPDTGVGGKAMFPGVARPWISSASFKVGGSSISPMLNDYVADVCLRNLAEAATIKLFFRVGIELLVPPASTMSSQLRASPGYDPVAMEKYFQVSRMLKDAYPEEYNSLDRLWNVIQNYARQLSPYLGMVPHVGPGLSMAASAMGRMGPLPRRRAEQASAVTKEELQDAVHQALVTADRAPRQSRRRGKKGGGGSPPAARGKLSIQRPQK